MILPILSMNNPVPGRRAGQGTDAVPHLIASTGISPAVRGCGSNPAAGHHDGPFSHALCAGPVRAGDALPPAQF